MSGREVPPGAGSSAPTPTHIVSPATTAGIVAYGFADELAGVVGDRTMEWTCELGDGDYANLLWAGGMRIRSVLASAGAKWKPAGCGWIKPS